MSKTEPLLDMNHHNFSKYDFVKSYVSLSKNSAENKIREKEAVIIADAIKENIVNFNKDLATNTKSHLYIYYI